MAYLKKLDGFATGYEQLDGRKVRAMLRRGTHGLKMLTNQDFLVYEKDK